MKSLFNLKKQLKLSHQISLLILIFLLIFASLFEIIGLGSIPILLGSILNQDFIFQFDINFLNNFFQNKSQKNQVVIISLFVVLFFLFKNIFLAFVIYFQGQLGKKITIYFSKKLFNFYINQDYLFLIKKNSSVLIRILSFDLGHTIIHILQLLNLFRDSLILVAIFFLLLISNPLVTFYLFIFFLSILVIFYILNKKNLFTRGKIIQQLSSDMIRVISETINIFKELKIYNIEKQQQDVFSKRVIVSEINKFKNYFIQQLPRIFLELAAICLIILIILYYTVNEKNFIELLPFLSLIVLVSLRLIPIFNGLANSLSTLRTTKPAFDLVIKELENANINPKKVENTNYVDFKNKIVLKNVSFKYPDSEKLILNNFNLEINNGDKIGIIGESGSGKTTLVNIIMGLLKISSGSIIIDDKKLDNNSYNYIKNLGYVPQEICLVEDTISKNIALGVAEREISRENLIKASSSAQILNFIFSLKEKFETKIKEKGSNFSAGQKQRLGVARALYKSPDIIILDESTSSLDSVTESQFIDDIFELNKDKTIIFISHKLSALKKCNKIFDLKKKEFI